MLIVNSVSAGVVRYFTDGRHPGRWSPAAGRLLDLAGPVEPRDLRRLLQGRHPETDQDLREGHPHRRRAGWDLIFGAPKSVSLLAAVTGRDSRSVEEAHVAAVEGVMDRLEQRLLLQRRGGDGARLSADGLLSASFDHSVNAAGEPHVHTHVLVANLSRSGQAWGAVVSSEWFVDRPGLAALYQLELRAQLAHRGWELDWRLRPDGMADLAHVPRAAVRAASTQSRLAATAGRHAARAMAAPQAWPDRVAKAMGPTGTAVPTTARPTDGLPPGTRDGQDRTAGATGVEGRSPLDDPSLSRTVAVRLTARRSDFRRCDVIVALASCHPAGATAREAEAWAESFCRQNQRSPSPTRRERWTTVAARRADDDLASALRKGRSGAGATSVEASEAHLSAGGRSCSDRLPADQIAALTTGGGSVHFLGANPGQTSLLAQAEVIDACRQVWDRAGRTVAVSTPTADGAARWAVLAGLRPHRAGDRPDILVVDQADRRTTAELTRLAGGPAGRLIFVEGGTLPRLTNPASHGLMEVADEVGRHISAPHVDWTPEPTAEGPRAFPEPSVGRTSAQSLLEAWHAERGRPLLVGLGLEETRALNRAVLLGLRSGRDGTGGSAGAGRAGVIAAGGGRGDLERFVPGDRVVVLRGRPGLPVYGTFGTVVASEDGSPGSGTTGRDHRSGAHGPFVRVAWESGEHSQIRDRRTLAAVGFGYAVTPHLANRTRVPLMVLGPAVALGRARDRVVLDVGSGLVAKGRDHSLGL